MNHVTLAVSQLSVIWITQASPQLLSRAKPAAGQSTAEEKEKKKKKKLPKLEDFIAARDYTGAVTFLEFERASNKTDVTTTLWIAYCYFHLGDYKRCMKVNI